MRIVHFPEFNLHAFIDDMDRTQSFSQIMGVIKGAVEAKHLMLTKHAPCFEGDTLSIDVAGFINLMVLFNSQHLTRSELEDRLDSLFPRDDWVEMSIAALQVTLPDSMRDEAVQSRAWAKAQVSDAELDGWRLNDPTYILTDKSDED